MPCGLLSVQLVFNEDERANETPAIIDAMEFSVALHKKRAAQPPQSYSGEEENVQNAEMMPNCYGAMCTQYSKPAYL
jgi:hypothetical protein